MRTIPAAGDWQPISTAPKMGQEILIVLPGGHSDHYHVMYWDTQEGEPAWRSRYHEGYEITEETIRDCHLLPMWAPINEPPSSLCEDAIVQHEKVSA